MLWWSRLELNEYLWIFSPASTPLTPQLHKAKTLLPWRVPPIEAHPIRPILTRILYSSSQSASSQKLTLRFLNFFQSCQRTRYLLVASAFQTFSSLLTFNIFIINYIPKLTKTFSTTNEIRTRTEWILSPLPSSSWAMVAYINL